MIQKLFFNNYLLMLPVVSWCVAQIIKTILYAVLNREFKGERLVGAGGWPSAHSALVCALVVGTMRKEGPGSIAFAFAFVLAMIVMYDALGVRRETGEQAKVINKLTAQLKSQNKDADFGKQLKEMVGHTPFQVVSGALIGIVIALLIPVF